MIFFKGLSGVCSQKIEVLNNTNLATKHLLGHRNDFGILPRVPSKTISGRGQKLTSCLIHHALKYMYKIIIILLTGLPTTVFLLLSVFESSALTPKSASLT